MKKILVDAGTLYSRLPDRPQLHLVLLVCLLLIGASLYFHGFIQQLPYHLHPDEPLIWLRAHHFHTTGTLDTTYPPLRLISLALEFRLLDWVTPGEVSQSSQFVMGRVTTILYSVLLLAFTYQAGRQLHSPAAGVAALIYLLAHRQMIEFSNVFKTDIFAWLWGMCCLMLAFHAVRTNSRKSIILSMAAAIAATLSKYTMLPIFAAVAVLVVVKIPRNRLERTVGIVLLASLLFAAILLLYDPNQTLLKLLPTHSYVLEQIYTRTTGNPFVSVATTWQGSLESFGTVSALIAAVGLTVAPFIWRGSRITQRGLLQIAVIAAPMLATYLMLSLLDQNNQRPHDRMLMTLCFALVFGAAVALIVNRQALVAAALVLILSVSAIRSGWETNSQLLWQDTRVMTADWVIEHVPEGAHIVVEYDHAEFDRAYGGFPSDKIFFVETADSESSYDFDDFARRGIEYFIADYRSETRGGYFSPERDAEAFDTKADVLLHVTSSGGKPIQGPERIIVRIPPLQQHPMHVFLGESIIFKGFDLPSVEYRAGDTVLLVLYWAALRETDHDYMVFAHIYAPDGEVVAQLDGPPGQVGNPTYQWDAGYFNWDEWYITLPDDILAGIYTLRIGMYDRDTQVRLPATDQDGTQLGDSIILTKITISNSP